MDLNFKKEITLKNGQKIILRYPQLKDINSLMDFVDKITQEVTYTNFVKGKKYSYEEELKYLEKLLEKIKTNKEVHIAAYQGLRYLGKADLITHTLASEKHIASLGIAITKDFRGLGLGTILLQELLLQAPLLKNIKIVTLSVFAKNLPAIKLYHNLGFKEFARLPRGSYLEGRFIDTLQMYKNI